MRSGVPVKRISWWPPTWPKSRPVNRLLDLLGESASTDGRKREAVKPGIRVSIVLKKDQKTGKLTEGVVQDLLTSAAYHPRGIKVRLEDGQIGRVQKIL